MALKSKIALLKCRIEKLNDDEVYISTEQYDGTPVCGLTLLSELTVNLDDPRINLLGVEILKETANQALISWPAQCDCLEMCLGDEFWINKNQLV